MVTSKDTGSECISTHKLSHKTHTDDYSTYCKALSLEVDGFVALSMGELFVEHKARQDTQMQDEIFTTHEMSASYSHYKRSA